MRCATLAWLVRNTYSPDPEIFTYPMPDSYRPKESRESVKTNPERSVDMEGEGKGATAIRILTRLKCIHRTI